MKAERRGPVILGVPWDGGNGLSRGSGEGPGRIRLHLSHGDWIDAGDVHHVHGEDPEAFFERVARRLTDERTFVIGGDHSISFTPIERLARQDGLSIVWIDAHTDFSNYDGTEWNDHKQVLRRVSSLPGVERMVVYGWRGFTLGDERMTDPRLLVIPSSRAAPDLRSRLPAGGRCYVSIDIDAMDPRWAPGTATPVPGGLSARAIVEALEPVFEACTVVGVDLVEFSPRHDVGDVTARLAARLVDDLCELWNRVG